MTQKRKKYTQPRPITLTVEQSNHAALKAMAKAANTSMSAVVNDLIAQAAQSPKSDHATQPA